MLVLRKGTEAPRALEWEASAEAWAAVSETGIGPGSRLWNLRLWSYPGKTEDKWFPITKLGCLVRDVNIKSLEEETATHSSILAWGIPRTEEPGKRVKQQQQ